MIHFYFGITLLLLATAGKCSVSKQLENNIEQPTDESSTIQAVPAEMKSSITHINKKDDLTAFINNTQKPTVIKFEAIWCGPCKQITPLFKEAADKLSEQVNFIIIDVDQSPEICQEYGIRGVPTILFINNGKETNKNDRMVGAFPSAEELINKIKKIFTI